MCCNSNVDLPTPFGPSKPISRLSQLIVSWNDRKKSIGVISNWIRNVLMRFCISSILFLPRKNTKIALKTMQYLKILHCFCSNIYRNCINKLAIFGKIASFCWQYFGKHPCRDAPWHVSTDRFFSFFFIFGQTKNII